MTAGLKARVVWRQRAALAPRTTVRAGVSTARRVDLATGLSPDAMAADDAQDQELLLSEIKIGCTLGMLMCLDRDHRLAYILGEILEMDHTQSAEIQDMKPAAFRKRLSRAGASIVSFMNARCGLANPAKVCRCRRRVEVAGSRKTVSPPSALPHWTEPLPAWLTRSRIVVSQYCGVSADVTSPRPSIRGWLMEIRRMSPRDMASACEVIGMAFEDNPNALAVVRGDRHQARLMMQATVRAAKLGRRYSHVLVAEDRGRVVGVLNAAAWPKCQLSIGEKLKAAPTIVRVAGWGVPRSLRMLSVWAQQDPQERHWHLGPLGVLPELQGRGIGQALLASFLKTVDEQRLPAYLETDVDRNVVFYEKCGFRVVAQAEINGVNNRFMWRVGHV